MPRFDSELDELVDLDAREAFDPDYPSTDEELMGTWDPYGDDEDRDIMDEHPTRSFRLGDFDGEDE